MKIEMEIKRDKYIEMLKCRMGNGMIKVITGIRRCGKSYLLFELFYKYLLKTGVNENHIIKLALDDRANKKYRNPDKLYDFLKRKIKNDDTYYILLDEVQYVDEFEDILNSLLHIKNTDVFVTGSNAKFLSKDVITEFRGRGDQVHIYPLSFNEFYSAFQGDKNKALREYMLYGGLPYILKCSTIQQKTKYLENLFTETYIKDVVNRNNIKNDNVLRDLLNVIASSIGSLTNPNKLVNTFKTIKKVGVAANTIKEYLDYLEDAFVVEKALRYDVKGKKYIETPLKYYFTDVGLRNARIGFRQDEATHIMENIIFNELKIRGFNVDVGIVTISEPNEKGNYVRKQTEIDFVCNMADKRYYIQSALSVSEIDKMNQECRPLMNTKDSFKKIIIVREPVIPWQTDKGILIIGLEDFLLDANSLDK